MNHVLVEGEDLPDADVPVMRLDDLVGQDVPTLIKIDVEGHELAVLRGASRTLRDARLLAVIMETNGSGARYGVADDVLIAVMRECGFAPFGYDPFQRRLKDSVPENGNTVFVRDRGDNYLDARRNWPCIGSTKSAPSRQRRLFVSSHRYRQAWRGCAPIQGLRHWAALLAILVADTLGAHV